MIRRRYLLSFVIAVAVLLLSVASASAQTGQLKGHVLLTQADGSTIKAAGAQVDVYRTDMSGTYPNKTDKNGLFVYAGLPYVGTYVIAVSMPGAAPNFKSGVKVGRDIDFEIVLSPGDGRKLTLDEVNRMAKSGGVDAGNSSASTGKESDEDKAKREEMIRKNKEIEEGNKKINESNRIVGDAFKAGNTALNAKNYDEAIKEYDTGLAADPEQPALLTNKTLALKARGVDKYNAAIREKDEAARKTLLDSAGADFRGAAEASTKAVELLKKEPAATDPAAQKQQATNKYAAFAARAEAMRLFVTKVDTSQVEAGAAAFEDYIAAETDPVKKTKAELDLAQLLLDAGATDKSLAQYQKILAAHPDDPDANLGAGLALYATGDKTKYQEAANYFQRFVDKAPDDHKFKNDAKDILANLKNTENVVPERTTRPARKRP